MINTRRMVAVVVTILICGAGRVALPQKQPSVVSSTTSSESDVYGRTPDQLFLDVWNQVNSNWLWKEKLSNWDRWRSQYVGKLKTEKDAELAVNVMLDSLGDRYSYLSGLYTLPSKLKQRPDGPEVVHRMLRDNIGYVKISTFLYQNTAEWVASALQDLNKHHVRGYILDLRGNPGGFVTSSFQTFALFVDTGQYVTLRGFDNGAPIVESYQVTKNGLEYTRNGKVSSFKGTGKENGNLTGNRPMIVLVDGDSASAAEVISGALRDVGRAQIYGCQTFGKGIAQNHYELGYSTKLQLTTEYVYLPLSECVQGVGLKPDVAVSGSAKAVLDASQKAIAERTSQPAVLIASASAP